MVLYIIETFVSWIKKYLNVFCELIEKRNQQVQGLWARKKPSDSSPQSAKLRKWELAVERVAARGALWERWLQGAPPPSPPARRPDVTHRGAVRGHGAWGPDLCARGRGGAASRGGFTAAVGRPGPKRTRLCQPFPDPTLNREADDPAPLPFSLEMAQAWLPRVLGGPLHGDPRAIGGVELSLAAL